VKWVVIVALVIVAAIIYAFAQESPLYVRIDDQINTLMRGD
jgi:beta-lactam-binding protein with PASTA domain